MYINGIVSYESHKCENCKNVDICKWCSDMKKKQDEVVRIRDGEAFTPISINISCRNFERKTTKRDVFNFAEEFYRK